MDNTLMMVIATMAVAAAILVIALAHYEMMKLLHGIGILGNTPSVKSVTKKGLAVLVNFSDGNTLQFYPAFEGYAAVGQTPYIYGVHTLELKDTSQKLIFKMYGKLAHTGGGVQLLNKVVILIEPYRQETVAKHWKAAIKFLDSRKEKQYPNLIYIRDIVKAQGKEMLELLEHGNATVSLE